MEEFYKEGKTVMSASSISELTENIMCLHMLVCSEDEWKIAEKMYGQPIAFFCGKSKSAGKTLNYGIQ